MSQLKTVLIVGGSGYLGTHLALKLREGYKVFATFHKRRTPLLGVTQIPLDLEDRDWTKRVAHMTHPDVVIYAAGYHPYRSYFDSPLQSKPGMDQELRHRMTHHQAKDVFRKERSHSDGPSMLTNFAEIMQSKFIYVSSHHVFDGSKGNYHENDTLLPLTHLGKMKSAGESVVKNKCLNFIVLRSSPLIGRGNSSSLSFIDRLRMSLDRGLRCEIADYEYHSFSSIYAFCELVQKLVESGIRNKLLHHGGLTKLSYFQLAQYFAKRFGYDERLIAKKEIPSQLLSYADRSSFDYSLNFTQSVETLKVKPLFLEESFDLIEEMLIPHF